VDREFSNRMLRYEVKIILKDSRPKRDEQKSEQVVSFNVNQIRDRKLLQPYQTLNRMQVGPFAINTHNLQGCNLLKELVGGFGEIGSSFFKTLTSFMLSCFFPPVSLTGRHGSRF
jgi:hypothetical protein